MTSSVNQSQSSTANIPVITIDGPSASGKGTIARLVAEKFGWHALDSGALYRLVAYEAFQKKVGTDDIEGLKAIALNLDVQFAADEHGDEQILLHGVDVTLGIRSEIAGEAASLVASIPEVRAALLERQHRFREMPGLVADGRDMGTIVFPDANLKVFLTASAEARAKRRHKQLMEKGVSGNLADLFEEISNRDQRDSQRATAPLKPAADAIVIDTTQLSIDQVVERVIALYQKSSTQN